MKTSDIKALIVARNKAGHKRTLMLEGPPGVGKTQIVQQAADELGIGFIAMHAPTAQPEDMGLPVPNKDRTGIDFLVPNVLPFEGTDRPKAGLLLIDELPQGDNATQKTLANLIQEREVHGKRLMDNWTIVATGNRQQDRAGANRILSHLANRLTVVEVEPNLDDWASWFVQQPFFRPEGLAFLRFRPALLSKFDPNLPHNPTPRAWAEGVFQTIGTIPQHLEFECFKGDVGEGPASEFVGFLNIYRQLPDIDKVIANPAKEKVPTDNATCYALAGALGSRATPENFGNIIAYTARMSPEYQVITIRDAIKRDADLTGTTEFCDWAAGPGAELLY